MRRDRLVDSCTLKHELQSLTGRRDDDLQEHVRSSKPLRCSLQGDRVKYFETSRALTSKHWSQPNLKGNRKLQTNVADPNTAFRKEQTKGISAERASGVGDAGRRRERQVSVCVGGHGRQGGEDLRSGQVRNC